MKRIDDPDFWFRTMFVGLCLAIIVLVVVYR